MMPSPRLPVRRHHIANLLTQTHRQITKSRSIILHPRIHTVEENSPGGVTIYQQSHPSVTQQHKLKPTNCSEKFGVYQQIASFTTPVPQSREISQSNLARSLSLSVWFVSFGRVATRPLVHSFLA